jgi:hypothetical protein
VIKIALDAKHRRVRAVPVDAFVVGDTKGCKGEGGIVLCDVGTKFQSLRVGTNEESA